MTWVDAFLNLIAIVKTLVLLANETRLKGEGASAAMGRVSQEALVELRAMRARIAKAGADFDSSGGMPPGIQYRD